MSELSEFLMSYSVLVDELMADGLLSIEKLSCWLG